MGGLRSAAPMWCLVVYTVACGFVGGGPSARRLDRLARAGEDSDKAAGGSSGSSSYEKRPNWRKRYRRVLPFDEARRCVQAIGFSCRSEWDEWVADGKKSPFLGPYVPSDPEAMYAEEWQGWDDFLGVILPFAQARLVSRLLGLKNQESWYRFVEADPVRLRSLRLPALPAVYYRNDWQGYEDWLDLPNETLYVPKEWQT
ncbi:unnamed protein product [Durusdinium trenchii]|uniref:Uncharacterized protein n=1 Tax=Durusdinium trenchii TaxID=1381693 RepID=A0ABP0QPH7_9DINO